MGINTIDLTGRIINGLRVIQRASISASANLRWETECIRCGARKTWDHQKLINAMSGATGGSIAQCELSNCRLFGTAQKRTPSTERPTHEPEPILPPAPVKAPLPVAVPKVVVDRDYYRLLACQREWGNKPWTFEQFNAVREFKPRFFAETMKQVEQSELAADLEKSEFERIMRLENE